MFESWTDSWKKAKYETAAYQFILSNYAFDINRLGAWKLAGITDEIFTKMNAENHVTEGRYTSLLCERLKNQGLI